MDKETSATTTFLQAEEAAVKLVDALSRLEEESRSYEKAASTMSEAGDSLQALSSAVGETSKKASEAIEAIRSVGSPAIIDGLTALNETLVGALSDLEAVTKSINTIEGIEESQNESLTTIKTSLETIAVAVSTANATSEQNSLQLKNIRLIAIAAVCVATVAAVMPFIAKLIS